MDSWWSPHTCHGINLDSIRSPSGFMGECNLQPDCQYCDLIHKVWQIYLAVCLFIFLCKQGALLDTCACNINYIILLWATQISVEDILCYSALNPSYQALNLGGMSTRQQQLSRLLSTMELTCFLLMLLASIGYAKFSATEIDDWHADDWQLEELSRSTSTSIHHVRCS